MNCSVTHGNIYGMMMFEYPPGATLLDINESNGLIPSHIVTQSQLNEWEQSNIIEADNWYRRQSFDHETLLTSEFVKKVHLKMFNKTWEWTGKFRKSNKNIGVEWTTISEKLDVLLKDVLH